MTIKYKCPSCDVGILEFKENNFYCNSCEVVFLSDDVKFMDLKPINIYTDERRLKKDDDKTRNERV